MSHLSRIHHLTDEQIKAHRYEEVTETECDDMSMEASVASLAAQLRMSFKAIAESPVIRRLTRKDGNDILKSPNSIKSIVNDYAEKKRQQLIQILQAMKLLGILFTLCFDEWSSCKRGRFMNIYLSNGSRKFNLGLHKISGALPADKLEEMLGSILNDFGLDWWHDLEGNVVTDSRYEDSLEFSLSYDINSSITLSSEEIDVLNEINNVLRPVYLTVNALCQDDANLAIADAVLLKMLSKID